jgi:molybdopterin molybdotransferase
MISYNEALLQIQKIAQSKTQKTELIVTEEAIGRTLADDLFAQESQPQFHLSAMDGFAVKLKDTLQAQSEIPVRLQILKCIAAGDVPAGQKEFANSTVAVEIMTGAVVPPEFNAVVRVEDIKVLNSELYLFKPLKEYENIRLAGSDFTLGKLMMTKGQVVTEAHIMGLAAQGITQLSVFKRPKVAIINTGKEVVPFTTNQLAAGQIRNSSGPLMRSLLKKYSCDLFYYQQIPDEPKIFFELMKNLMEQEPDLILTTGAVSMGVYDFIKTVLTDLKVKILFHKVAIRPGKPLLFGTHGSTAIFAIPGNPISTAVAMRFFVAPYLRILQKQSPEEALHMPLSKPVKKPDGLTCFFKARADVIEWQNQNISAVETALDQGSAVISSFLEAQYWVKLDVEKTHYQVGDVVVVYPLF